MNLQELIRTMKDTRRYDDLTRDTLPYWHSVQPATDDERAAVQKVIANGGSPGSKRWEQMVNRGIAVFPDPHTIRAIAVALGVTEEKVIMACAESLGLDVDDRGSLFVTMVQSVPGTERLTDAEVAAFLSLIRVAVARNEPEPEAPAPPAPRRRR